MIMGQRVAVWFGTDHDLQRLRDAVLHNCRCTTPDGANSTCQAHAMLADQDTLNHMVFAAAQRHRYIHGEFDPLAEWW